jgi:hypothetical protein
MRYGTRLVAGQRAVLCCHLSTASGKTTGSGHDERPPADAQVATFNGLAIVVGEVERELRRSTGAPSTAAVVRDGVVAFGSDRASLGAGGVAGIGSTG